MAKQLNVNLSMTADTSQAKTQLQELQSLLTKLASSANNVGSNKFFLSQELIEASNAAETLKMNLTAATNVNTGKLDLGKFQQEMNKSQMSLEKYQIALAKLGPEGNQAFASLASSITKAEIPIRRSNALLSEFATTLKNTARWQISSSVLHGFMSTLSGAYSYAQQLNKSLNEIRIVTGESEEQMARFAEQANKAAQSLSATTTAYTNAALIFYQQGLSDEAVKERTDTVIKMSNVTGDSAEDVSSYMTAIWENFYDGSKSLEYYADVITRLGADTAASSAEIAEGLESFASIGETIGLSYEYATSALTTIVAKTRASASEVGNGLRTIFSRLQNLSLGETLDDGTDLTKYSKALETVGVNIKDASGELKSMDSILDDLAGKWDTLDRAEKAALANTVGGVRQYTKLISLMDNWDFMKQNIASATNSSGSLQEQADIYAESWEAAQKRVRAAAQEIYDALLDDKFFISVVNLLAKFLNGIDDVIDGLGGLKGVLFAIGAIASTVFKDQMISGIENAMYSLKMLTKAGRQSVKDEQDKANELLIHSSVDTGTASGAAMGDAYKQQSDLQSKYIENAEHMSQTEQAIASSMLDQQRSLIEQVKLSGQEVDNAQAKVNILSKQVKDSSNAQNLADSAKAAGIMDKAIKQLGASLSKNITSKNFKELKQWIDSVDKSLGDLNGDLSGAYGADAVTKFEKLKNALLSVGDATEPTQQQFNNLNEAFDSFVAEIGMGQTNGITNLKDQIDALTQAFTPLCNSEAEARQFAEQYAQANRDLGSSTQDLAQKSSLLTSYTDNVSKALDEIHQKTTTTAQGINAYAQTIMTVGMVVSSIKGLIDTWGDSSKTAGEKVLATLTTLGMVIPMLTSALSAQSIAAMADAGAQFILSTGFGSTAIASEVAAGGVASFGAVLYTVLWPLGLIVAAIGVLILAFKGIVAIVESIEANSPEGKLKAAEEKAEDLADSLEDAKNKAQELQSAFDGYNSIYEKLQNCTKGTQEWSDALAEANAKTTELLQQFPELLKADNLFDENGLLNPEVLSSALDNANSAVDSLNAANLMAQAEVNQAKVEVSKQSYADDNASRYMKVAGNTVYTDYAAANKDLETLLNTYQTTGSSALELSDAYGVLGINMDEATESEQKLANSLLELANQSISASNSIDNASLSIINSWAAANDVDLETGQAQLMTDAYQDIYNNISDSIKDASDQNNKANNKDKSKISGTGTSFDDMSVTDAFNKARGETYSLASNGVRGTDNNRTYAYLEKGKEKEYTIAEMQATIAASAALEKMGATAEKAATSLGTLDKNVGKEIGAGIKGWIASGNFESMTQSDFEKMTEGLSKDENGNYNQNEVEDYLKKALGTDDVASVLGDDWYTNFNSAAVNFEHALDDLTKNMSENAIKAYQAIDGLDNMTIANQKELADAVQSAFEANGSAGANALVEQINAALKDGASQEDISAFNDVLSGMNWDTASIADFKDALVNAGIDAEKLGIDVNAIFEAMSTGAVNELSNIQKTYKEIQDIAKDLSTGDTISDEDYNALVSQIGTEAMDGFFSTMADGTHQLVGDAEDFYNVITENSHQMMLNNISNSSDLAGSLKKTSADGMNNGHIGTTETADAATAYLQTLELTEEETAKLAQVQDEYNQTGAYTAENFAVLNALMADHNITEEEFNNLITQNNETIRQNSEALLSTATSLEELDGLVTQVATASGGVVYGYSEALINLASQYDNCSNEIEDYQKALSSGNEETIAAAEDSLRAAATIGELTNKYDLVAEDVETQARLLQENRKELNLTKEQAARLAVANQRMNRGVKTLNENFSDWKKVLTSADHTSQDYAETLNDTYDALADLTGAVDAASIPLDFLDNTTEAGSKHLQWLEKAAQGDVQAINLLGSALAVASVQAMEMDDNFTQAFADMAGVGVDQAQNKFLELQNTVSSAMQEIHDAIQSGMPVEEIQDKINDMGNGWVDSLNQMAIATGMSVDQMNALLGQLGVQAKVEVQNVKQRMQVPMYVEKVESTPVTTYDTVVLADGSTKQVPVTKNEWAHYTVPAGFKDVEGVVQVAQISTEENSMSPAVTYTGTGGASVGGGVSPSSISSGSGGGGGGSSKSQEHNNEDHKDYSDEKERYHVIKNQLEDLTSQYDRISNAKDKAFGSARLANLNKEIAAQKKLTQANKQYLDEIEGYLAQDKSAIASYGAIFDNNGTILNYDEIVKQQVDAYNRAVDTFNAAYTDDEGAKAAFEAAQDAYDKFQDALSQYEETQDLFNDQTQTYIDSLNAERELLLERTQLQVELKVNVEEDALNFLQYALDNIENKAYDCAEAFGYLNDMTAAYLGTAKAYEEGLRSLFANHGLSDADFDDFINGNSATFNTISQMLSNGESAGFQSEDVDTIREYVQALISANENLQEVRQTVHDQILTVWDEWNEKLDDSISKLEHLQAIQESYTNIIDIVGQKNLGVSNAFIRNLSQQGIDQANDKLVAEKARYDALKKARDEAYATFEEQKNKGILSEEEIKMWEDSLRQMDEDVQSASEDFQSAWEDALTSINEAFEAEVDRIVQAYDDAAAGLMGSMSQLQEAFDRKSDLADQYLDDYEKIYQFSKLNRDIENSIDSTSNVKAKKELLELQSKINAYEEAGTEISEYQMQQLQQEYELKKAQIELEEASDAKSQVKMQRDSEGNYSYVYTANSDDVAKAEQNYEDKLHAMQQSNAEYINDLQSNMIQMEQDYQDKVKEIMTDTSLTAEERMAQLNELNDYYDEKMKFYISEAQLWEQNSQTLYEKDWMNYATMTGYKISEEDKWLDHWNETQLALLTGFETLEDYQTNHNINVANLLLASGEAFSAWQTNIEEAMNNAGTSLGTFEEDATDAMQTVAEESEKTKDQMVNDSKDMVDAVNDVVAAVANWETQYSKIVQNMLARNTALVQSFNSLIAAWSKFEAAENAHNSSSGNDNSSGSGSGSGTGSGNESGSSGSGSGSGSSADNSDKIEGVAAAIWMDGSAAGWGNGSTRRQRLQEKGVSGAQDYINAHASNGDIYSAWASKRGQLRQFYYGSFDTGGYTGEWGLDGKLALLHEKELVLNADDTTNFLKAIDVVRQISDMIDLNALSSAGGLSSLFAATASSSSQNLQQEVHITAEFPNATDKDQISEAFSDLVNLASQYANRK